MTIRFLPLVWMILFFAVGIVWQAWLQQRRYGSFGIILFRATNWSQRMRDSVRAAVGQAAVG
jgi:hypothetical protein